MIFFFSFTGFVIMQRLAELVIAKRNAKKISFEAAFQGFSEVSVGFFFDDYRIMNAMSIFFLGIALHFFDEGKYLVEPIEDLDRRECINLFYQAIVFAK